MACGLHLYSAGPHAKVIKNGAATTVRQFLFTTHDSEVVLFAHYLLIGSALSILININFKILPLCGTHHANVSLSPCQND